MNTNGQPSNAGNSNSISGPVNPSSSSIPIWVAFNELTDTKTQIDEDGTISENIGIFPSGTSSHPKCFYTSTTDITVVQTNPITFDDLNVVNPIPFSYFQAGQTIKVTMSGVIGAGVNPGSYTVRLVLYDVTLSLGSIDIAAGINTSFKYEAEVTFRSTTSIVSNQSLSYFVSASGTYRSFMARNTATTIDQTVSPTIKLTANCGPIPDASGLITSSQCMMCYY